MANAYDVGFGIKGRLPSGKYIVFSTYEEYMEYFEDELNNMNDET